MSVMRVTAILIPPYFRFVIIRGIQYNFQCLFYLFTELQITPNFKVLKLVLTTLSLSKQHGREVKLQFKV